MFFLSVLLVLSVPSAFAADFAKAISFSPLFQNGMVLQREGYHHQSAVVFGEINHEAIATFLSTYLKPNEHVEATYVSVMVANQKQFYVDEHGGTDGYTVIGEETRVYSNSTEWSVRLRPMASGGDWDIWATVAFLVANDREGYSDYKKELMTPSRDNPVVSTNLTDVTFGDVWICSGQSNMNMPIKATYEATDVLSWADEQVSKQRDFLRIAEFTGRDNAPTSKWSNLTSLVGVRRDQLQAFSATCFEFARELLQTEVSPTLGVVVSAVPGSKIDSWLPAEAASRCNKGPYADNNAIHGTNYQNMFLPLSRMSVAGVLWYQGEADMPFIRKPRPEYFSYACRLRELIKTWRTQLSVVSLTTHPDVPFGVVPIVRAPGRYPWFNSNFRVKQTACIDAEDPTNVIPNVFTAQTYDLEDPWGGTRQCNGDPCCGQSGLNECAQHQFANASWLLHGDVSSNYPPDLHPRTKTGIARRLAIGARYVVYNAKKKLPFTGPVAFECELRSDELEVQFESGFLAADHVEYEAPTSPVDDRLGLDKLLACIGTMEQCSCMGWEPVVTGMFGGGAGKDWRCVEVSTDRGDGDSIDVSASSITMKRPDSIWVPLPFLATASASSLTFKYPTDAPWSDIKAIRYGWSITDQGLSCCADDTWPCKPENCPIKSSSESLPAHPFFFVVDQKNKRCFPMQYPQCTEFKGSGSIGGAGQPSPTTSESVPTQVPTTTDDAPGNAQVSMHSETIFARPSDNLKSLNFHPFTNLELGICLVLLLGIPMIGVVQLRCCCQSDQYMQIV